MKLWKFIVNHRKIKKIGNEDVLESSWLDLCSGCIILYVLVEKSCFRFLPMLFREKFISTVVLLQLTWNCYGSLLMWCLMCSKNFSFIGVCMSEFLIYLSQCLFYVQFLLRNYFHSENYLFCVCYLYKSCR